MTSSRAWRFQLGLLAGTSVAYLVLAQLSYFMTVRPASVTIWLPSGLALGILLLLERRWWPAALAGALLGNAAADLLNGAGIDHALAGSTANGLETLVAAALLQRALGHPVTLGTLREVGWLILGAAVATNAVTAIPGGLVLQHWGDRPLWLGWLIWWVGDGMGMLILTPVVLTLAALVREGERVRWPRLLELAVVLGALVLIAGPVLARDPGSPRPLGGYPYLAFPPLFWAAVRFGPWGAAVATLVLSGITIWNAAQAAATVVSRSIVGETLEVYSFIALASVSSLVPAAILNQRRRAERRLAESEERFRQMAESIQEAFYVVELPSLKTLYVSPVWSAIWGRPLEDAGSPETWSDTIHPDDRGGLDEALRRVAAGEAVEITYRVTRPDGSTRWVRSKASPVRDATGAVYRLVGVTEDITELRHTEGQLLHSQKMESVGRLAGGVAHDFNNLLTVILAETELLLHDGGLRGDGTRPLENIRQAAERATSLTRQLLAFSRRQVVQPVVFDLSDLVRGTSTLLDRLLGARIELVVSLPAEPTLVRADRSQIEQVITNLAVNARDAMPEGGRLSLEVQSVTLDDAYVRARGELAPGPYVVLVVSDTGTGMSEALMERIFEPFFTTKEGGTGTGLGLSTSYGIAQQAGGQLTVYSELGVGSAFRLYLPAAAPAAGEPPSLAPGTPAVGTETILLVEDEEGVRAVAARMLRAHGYQVLEAPDAESARDVLAGHPEPVHLLFTDVVLPGQGGRWLAEEARALRPGIRVLFTSGYTDDVVLLSRLLDHGAELLQKPFTRQSLTAKVREVLSSARAARGSPS